MSIPHGSSVPKSETSFSAFGGPEGKISRRFMILAEVKGGETMLGGLGIRCE